ncbi:hypothetical protein CSA17_05870 [bacterium DOLJORAL78_65_58]|nr:MAG: hypothetical protein CSA17_05870 [bacterium DOLJORAL78_65_58]
MTGAVQLPDNGPESHADMPSDEDVPYGVASTWLLGRQMLADGNVEEALQKLHAVYRIHADVPQLAWDFQEALVAGGYLQDAVRILDGLVGDYPDSAAFRVQRAEVLLSLGEAGKALRDLRETRRRGQETLAILMAEATVLATMNKPNEALDVCREAVEKFPSDGPPIYASMASILERADRQEEIPALLEEASEVFPGSRALRAALVRSLVLLGRDEEAWEVADAADEYFATATPNEAEPDSLVQEGAAEWLPAAQAPGLVSELAALYAQQGRSAKAIDLLAPRYRQGRLTCESSLWLARLYLSVGRQADGLATVDEVLERWPRSGQAWFLKGRILEADKQLTEALDFFAKGVECAPDDPEVRMGYVRGMLLAWEGELFQANSGTQQRERVARVREHTLQAARMVAATDATDQLVLGYAFLALDMLPEAAEAFTLAAMLPELNRSASLQLSVCYDEMDQPKQTRAVLEDLRRQFPDDAEVANALGYFLAEKNTELDRAESLIHEALDQDPGSAAYLDSMGWVKYRQGRFEEAFDYMIQAVNVLPEEATILEHLGLVLREMGQVAEAEEMLRRALILGGDSERIEKHLQDLAAPGTRQ